MPPPPEKPTVPVDQLEVLRGMMQRSIDVAEAARAETGAARAEGEARGVRQDRAIEIVGEQVKSLGTAVEKIDGRVLRLEEDRAGIKRHVSMTEEQTKDAVDGAKRHVAVLEGDVQDLRLGVKALTAAVGVRVPRPDGSMPPEGKPHRNEIERQSIRQKATLWLVGFVVAAGGLKELGFFEAVKELFFSHH